MPRSVSPGEKMLAIDLMNRGIGQREIARRTGLSRPYLRKLARTVGHQFERNGIEILGQLCMCSNCGAMFRRPPSKVKRSNNQFCDMACRAAFFKGPTHPSWKKGKSSDTFSKWLQNQAAYADWREAVLARDNFKCVISGREDNLEAHHILPKAQHEDLSLDVDNGITVCREVHDRIHELVRNGMDYQDAVEKVREEHLSNEDN